MRLYYKATVSLTCKNIGNDMPVIFSHLCTVGNSSIASIKAFSIDAAVILAQLLLSRR